MEQMIAIIYKEMNFLITNSRGRDAKMHWNYTQKDKQPFKKMHLQV